MTSITKAPGHAQVRCEVCLVHDQDGGLRPVSYSTTERPNGRIGVCEVCELFIAKGRITLTTETLAVIRHIRARHHWMVDIRHGAGVSPCSDPRCGNEWHYHAGGGNPQLNGRPWKVCSNEGCDHVYAIESEHRLKLPGDVCWDCHQRRRAEDRYLCESCSEPKAMGHCPRHGWICSDCFAAICRQDDCANLLQR